MKARILPILILALAGFILIPAEAYTQSSSKNVSKDVIKVSIKKPSRPSKTRHIENNSHKKKTNTMARYNKKHMVECPTFADYSTKPKLQREKAMRKKNS